MSWLALALALSISLVLTFVFAAALRGELRRRPLELGGAALAFFVVVLLATWAGGVWLAPFGPQVWGISWLSFLLIGVVVALMLAAGAIASPRHAEVGARSELWRVQGSLLFWILVAVLLFSVALAYLS
jgi:hypothetical protein